MTELNEYTLVEKPIIEALTGQYGYQYIAPSKHSSLRARENEVLFRPLVIAALIRINSISHDDAKAIFSDLAGINDNQRWTEILRGNYSRKLSGGSTHRTIRLIDFDDPSNNNFACTNQLRVLGAVVRKPDIVVYVNGIPLVVIEAKSPINPSQNAFDAIDQVRSAEKEVPRLFHSNLLNIATNDLTLMYGATGAPSEHWSRWRDPWPRKADEFTDETEKGLYALLEPSRLLDILAHFVVFETRDGVTVKKVCRYQQYRAVNKMVERVIEGKHRAGLIWHTQGSGKSLTMVFAALKLKFHRGITSDRLQNPNLLVITDRIDLHAQITATFAAVGIQNVHSVHGIRRPVDDNGQPRYPRPGAPPRYYLQEELHDPGVGKTVLSTVFKFNWDDPGFKSKDMKVRRRALKELAITGSENWILMVDEAHRTQERDLGAYLRAILPSAVRFGFTGTPVKKTTKTGEASQAKGALNTHDNFGPAGEVYLDRYGIDDAVADGATVPIYYQGRMTQWHLHDKEIDVLFDQWFVNEPEEKLAELKARGVTRGDLARFGPRIQLIALDIWAHYRAHVAPDGFKAQVCAIDRRACVAYKEALDEVIANTLIKEKGLSQSDAHARAAEMSVCIYSPGQHDGEQHPELVKHQIPPEDVTPIWVPRFLDPEHPLTFLIVCNKLLTGFDAPIEQALYLDNPLTEHNLLQAIARTNRRYGSRKDHGLIVDYIGVSQKLSEALASYRSEDVASAMHDQDELADHLRVAHRAVMEMISQVPRTASVKEDVKAVIAMLGTEDEWFIFRGLADALMKAYSALAPDPQVLPYQVDLKFIAAVLPYGRLKFEQVEETDWKKYSEKIRAMLNEHLEVTGLKTVCKLRSLTDPDFFNDFGQPEDLQTAAVRKLSELKKATAERAVKNSAQYEKFSDRIKALIAEFSKGLVDAQGVLDVTEKLAHEVLAEDQAYKSSGLNAKAYSIARILDQFTPTSASKPSASGDGSSTAGGVRELSPLEQVAADIDALYTSSETAPAHWQDKSQLKKELRGKVRRLVQPLGLEGWKKEIPNEVEHYAVHHYIKG